MSATTPNSMHITSTSFGQAVDAKSLAREAPVANKSLTCNQIIHKFHDDPSLNCIAVLDGDMRIIGILRSLNILRRGTEGFFHELIGRRSCTEIMDPDPLVFDASASLFAMSKAVAELDDRHLIDGFFVTENGNYLGAGRMTDLIKAVTEHQITVARYANPLTLLPGNVPIDQHIQGCLSARRKFVVCYFDLDNFKPFNDVYGYSAGDEVIQLAARSLTNVRDDADDFLGHVGGDDFVAVFTSDDWETRVQRALRNFDQEVTGHFWKVHIDAGGLITNNRQGVEVFHNLVSLSAGIVRIAPGDFELPSEISTRLVEAKKQAKKSLGSTYFVDRRIARGT
ncbi:MAG: GGDEF domain-containing protein [Rhodoferax sp.]|uniref:GGDEF domain-containing protein n=1 Tax=Rhodoferax sp. TaxID=50421 RepID=UPI00301761D6